jgi:hypothetical protein
MIEMSSSFSFTSEYTPFGTSARANEDDKGVGNRECERDIKFDLAS